MRALLAGVFVAFTVVIASQGLAQRGPSSAPAIETKLVPCPTATGLVPVPEITSNPGHRLQATLKLEDGSRTIWYRGTQCASIPLRYFTGHAGLQPGPDNPAFTTGEILPGPTLRARIGDWVEIAFLNHVNPLDFAQTLDRGDHGDMSGHAMAGATPDPYSGCDLTYQGSLPSHTAGPTAVPTSSLLKHSPDAFPNCLHGSTTTNVHFHGTHTTPNTTGDNVLLFVRPVNRISGAMQPSDQKVSESFAEFFAQCEKHGYPATWSEMPQSWRTAQSTAIDWYDRNTPYNGKPRALPTPAWLEPVNTREIAHGLWPQYQIGATPYCFPLPAYVAGRSRPVMGQSPGTHWYHAHKHGSTALNVANGMTGALIIEGPYDDALRGFYAPKWPKVFRDRVLMVQQLTPTLNLTVPGRGPHSRAVPVLSVNGRRAPVVTLRRNEVELFRFINGAERDAAFFKEFRRNGTPCSRPSTDPCVHWNQTAQDGVQFAPANYDPDNAAKQGYHGAAQDSSFYLAPANRADLLVQAPDRPGTYDLVVIPGLCRPYPAATPAPSPAPLPTANPCPQQAEQVLLRVNVPADNPVSPAMPFIPYQSFPTPPPFQADIPASSVFLKRKLVFEDSNGLRINGKLFADTTINQTMQLNAVEEWTVANRDPDKEHPFHIHINPFQIVDVFEPKSTDAAIGRACVKPDDPSTWKPCPPKPGVQASNFEWWDTFAIPSAWNAPIVCGAVPMSVDKCPQVLRDKVPSSLACASDGSSCTVLIPGYFKLRTRFVDFTGQYVLHCHILTHEDRGMMELIQVVPDKTIYTHH